MKTNKIKSFFKTTFGLDVTCSNRRFIEITVKSVDGKFMGEIPSSFRQLCVKKYGYDVKSGCDFIGGLCSPFYLKMLPTDLVETINSFPKTI